ncbi:MAG: RnfABCDGE type electron transport complex subunit D [Spirochaetota bacterium]
MSTQQGAPQPQQGIDKKTLEKQLVVTSSPQFHDEASTSRIMWSVSACLLPAAMWGVYVFGLSALWVMVAATVAAVVTEYGIARAIGRENTLSDGSAVLTGFLVGLNMPPAIPAYIPIVGSVFAIAVVKWTFGGLGTNWMNPALAGRVFVFFSWTGHMTTWKMPATLPQADAASGATVLGAVKSGVLETGGAVGNPNRYLARIDYPRSGLDSGVTAWLNDTVLAPLGINMPAGYVDPFVGNIPGSIGEVSALLLLLGTIYLFQKRIITWEIPTAYFTTFAVFIWMFGGVPLGTGAFTGDVLFHVFAGGLILGMFYMATDTVTSPMTSMGMLIYGAGAGLLTFLIRIYGSYAEGVSLAIILMNMVVPMINRYTGPSIFGKRAAHVKEGA